VFVANYLQNITRNLTLGVEALAQKGPGGALDSGMTFVGRYTGNDYVATTNLGLNGTVQASYFHKVCYHFPCSVGQPTRISPYTHLTMQVTEQISLGTELELLANAAQRESVFTVGGKFDFKQAVFRCQFDSHGKVAAVLEEKLAPGLSFVISGELDHSSGESRFGLGLLIGS